jgi:DNA polymerase I-like protein with 3'-5' exonuclease and polymerase domains
MNPKYTHTSTIKSLLNLLDAGVPLAVTAPLLLEDKFIIGYYSPTADSFGCAVIPAADARTIYEPNTAVIKVHGLKRTWEVLKIGTRDVNLDLVHDTKLMAYLLDPDSGDRGLTLSALAGRYLNEDYPHRILDIRYSGYPAAFYASLAYDAELIWRLHEQLSQSMTADLWRLYRDTELPLMVILDAMRRTGIGVNGYTCIKERMRVQAKLAELARTITQGRDVDLSSGKKVFQLLVDQDV